MISARFTPAGNEWYKRIYRCGKWLNMSVTAVSTSGNPFRRNDRSKGQEIENSAASDLHVLNDIGPIF